MKRRSQLEVWAYFKVAKKSVYEIHSFFRDEYNIHPDCLIENLHLTVYHSRRPMCNLEEKAQTCYLSVDTNDTRFMVLAPGGENPRPDIIPSENKIGIRIKKGCPFRDRINDYRKELISYETKKVLGTRKASNSSRSAFGARSFQPHISIIEKSNEIVDNLTSIGTNFRDSIHTIHFDRFVVRKTMNF